jgi:hypothetical protein
VFFFVRAVKHSIRLLYARRPATFFPLDRLHLSIHPFAQDVQDQRQETRRPLMAELELTERCSPRTAHTHFRTLLVKCLCRRLSCYIVLVIELVNMNIATYGDAIYHRRHSVNSHGSTHLVYVHMFIYSPYASMLSVSQNRSIDCWNY